MTPREQDDGLPEVLVIIASVEDAAVLAPLAVLDPEVHVVLVATGPDPMAVDEALDGLGALAGRILLTDGPGPAGPVAETATLMPRLDALIADDRPPSWSSAAVPPRRWPRPRWRCGAGFPSPRLRGTRRPTSPRPPRAPSPNWPRGRTATRPRRRRCSPCVASSATASQGPRGSSGCRPITPVRACRPDVRCHPPQRNRPIRSRRCDRWTETGVVTRFWLTSSLWRLMTLVEG